MFACMHIRCMWCVCVCVCVCVCFACVCVCVRAYVRATRINSLQGLAEGREADRKKEGLKRSICTRHANEALVEHLGINAG